MTEAQLLEEERSYTLRCREQLQAEESRRLHALAAAKGNIFIFRDNNSKAEFIKSLRSSWQPEPLAQSVPIMTEVRKMQMLAPAIPAAIMFEKYQSAAAVRVWGGSSMRRPNLHKHK
jgi:hypothetical protein